MAKVAGTPKSLMVSLPVFAIVADPAQKRYGIVFTFVNACSLRKPRLPVPGRSIRQWQGDLFLSLVPLVLCASILPVPCCLHGRDVIVAFRLRAAQLDLHSSPSLPLVDPVNQSSHCQHHHTDHDKLKKVRVMDTRDTEGQ